MSTFTFTEMQIIDVWVSSPEKDTILRTNSIFISMQEHLHSTANIRLVTGFDPRIMGTDFYTKQTEQVKEQIPELIGMIEQVIANIGFTKCSVSW